MAFGGVPGGSSSSLDAIRRLLKYRAADCASAMPLLSGASASAEDVDRMEELSAEPLATESADAVRRLMKLEDESKGKLSDSGQGGDAGVGDDALMATFWLMLDTNAMACLYGNKQATASSSSTLVTGGVSASLVQIFWRAFRLAGAKKISAKLSGFCVQNHM